MGLPGRLACEANPADGLDQPIPQHHAQRSGLSGCGLSDSPEELRGELVRRYAGRLRVTPNRLKLQRRGDGWRTDLLDLLAAMEELYQGARINAGV